MGLLLAGGLEFAWIYRMQDGRDKIARINGISGWEGFLDSGPESSTGWSRSGGMRGQSGRRSPMGIEYQKMPSAATESWM